MMLNHIVIMGRLTRDPELRRTQSGKAVASFSVACERDWKQDGGQTADFIDCVAWGACAEFVGKFFSKGDMVIVSGRLQIRVWKDAEGKKRYAAEIVADHVYFGSSKRADRNYNDSVAQTTAEFSTIDNEDPELPFK